MTAEKFPRGPAARCLAVFLCVLILLCSYTAADCRITAQANGHYEDSLKQAKKVLKELNKWSKYDVRNKMELLANIHSCLGNGYLETGDYNKALQHHTTDYDLANEQ